VSRQVDPKEEVDVGSKSTGRGGLNVNIKIVALNEYTELALTLTRLSFKEDVV
jgi:hypothetical protein